MIGVSCTTETSVDSATELVLKIWQIVDVLPENYWGVGPVTLDVAAERDPLGNIESVRLAVSWGSSSGVSNICRYYYDLFAFNEAQDKTQFVNAGLHQIAGSLRRWAIRNQPDKPGLLTA